MDTNGPFKDHSTVASEDTLEFPSGAEIIVSGQITCSREVRIEDTKACHSFKNSIHSVKVQKPNEKKPEISKVIR